MNEDRAILELLKLTEEIDRLKDTNKQQFWMPLPRQKDFLDCTAKSKALTAGNQCFAIGSLITDAVTGETKPIQDWFGSLSVVAFNGVGRSTVKTTGPVDYGDCQTYRFTTASGATFCVSSEHMVYTTAGWAKACDLFTMHNEWRECQLVHVHGSLITYTNLVDAVDTGIQKVYGIQVPELENMIVDGIIHHNCGKSTSLAFEESCHLTGIYPDWWIGVRYDRPVDIWMVGPTTLRVRDTLQVQLFGSLGEMGTGMIPKDRIIRTVARPGIPECIDKGYVKHVSGGQSSVQFFSYEMGREKFQGSTIDRVLLDEEPPEGIYGECKMRVGVKDGYIVFTFTPLSGMTPMMNAILNDDHIVKFSIAMDDCPWWTPDKIERQLAGLSDHEKNARRYGIPAASGGTIFQFSEEEYACQSFEIPNYWPRIGGLDIGINHPTAAVSVAVDPDDNTLYVYQEYGATGEAPAKHAMTLKHWRIPFALSHDAFNRSSGTGNTTAKIYEEEGIRAFNAGRDLWGHINHIRNLICEGKLWIFKDKCPNLLKEMKMYRTKDNNPDQVVDKDDDYVAALRHATFHSDKAEIIGRRKTVDVTIKQWEPFDKGLGV